MITLRDRNENALRQNRYEPSNSVLYNLNEVSWYLEFEKNITELEFCPLELTSVQSFVAILQTIRVILG